jgi:RNA polymerase sigma-70 factor (ECF subfamily)
MTDEQLLSEARRGSRPAFEALFERYRSPMWAFFRRRVREPARAEELVQDVFVAVLQGASRFEGRGSCRAFLFGIAFNVLKAEWRRAGRNACDPLGDEVPAAAADLDAGLWVRRALAQLDTGDREILMLGEYEQLRYDELADVLRLTVNTVRSRLFRARMALKSALQRNVSAELRVSHEGR